MRRLRGRARADRRPRTGRGAHREGEGLSSDAPSASPSSWAPSASTGDRQRAARTWQGILLCSCDSSLASAPSDVTDALVIEVEGLERSASARPRRSPGSASASSRARSRASSGRTAPASRRRCARCSGSCIRMRAATTVLGVPYREARPAAAPGRRGARGERGAIRAAPGETTCRVQAAAAGLPASRVDEVLALVELSAGREAAREGLLARDAPAPRARDRAARRPGGARARRAGERARSRRDPVAARPPPRARRRGPHRPRLEPRARRGGADRRPGRDHPPRPADPAGGDRRRARRRPGRDDGCGPRTRSDCASCSTARGRRPSPTARTARCS